jgi:formamidopyrimidine-DNA glycosylase
MPELPEVETVTRALKQFVEGRRITRIEAHVEKLRYPLDFSAFEEQYPNQFVKIRRRAKYIIVELLNHQGLLIHLGMTGSFRLESIKAARQKHDHVEFYLDHDEVLRYSDYRRFGFFKPIQLPDNATDPAELPLLAPEPLSAEFDVKWLRKVCRQRHKPIKNLLMDNAFVVGVGNIYASEALFRAGIRPDKPASAISALRVKRLHKAIIDVLQEAIEAGGTTIINFTSLNEQTGYFARHLNVYDRFGESCYKCQRGKIQRTVMAGRSTYFCAVCQR